MAALFGHVWDTGDLGRNMRGGSGLLPDALGRDLGPIVRTGTRVTSVSPTAPACACGSRARAAQARSARAPRSSPCPRRTSPRLLGDALTPELADALALVRFGPMVVLSILTDEAEPMPWDDLYSVLTPDYRFNMFFNHANALHGTGSAEAGQRADGVRRRRPRPGADAAHRGRDPDGVPGRPRPPVPAGAAATSPRRG